MEEDHVSNLQSERHSERRDSEVTQRSRTRIESLVNLNSTIVRSFRRTKRRTMRTNLQMHASKAYFATVGVLGQHSRAG